MTPAQYLKARFNLESEYREKLRSLDQVWQMFHGESPPPEVINGHSDAVKQVRGAWRQVAQAVIAAIPDSENFTVREVEAGMNAKEPSLAIDRQQISVFLKKLADDKELVIVSHGRGATPAVYAKKA
jgi:hypothetical protein